MSSLLRSLTDLPLSRTGINRNYAARLPENALVDMAAEPATRVVIIRSRRALANGASLLLVSGTDIPADQLLGYLGHTLHDAPDAPAGTTVLLAVEPDDAPEREGAEWLDLRASGDALSARDADLLTEAMALVNWHAGYTFCPKCGADTRNDHSGWARRCDNGHELFPRTDPAVIVLVLDDDDRLLLGSNALWENNRYSLLAGFVEAGESFEQAVIREVEEESGITVADPSYLGSQPWPFPRSLMVGFEARVAAGTDPAALRPDGEEILDLRWFTRDQLRDQNSGLLLPGRTSIARALIEAWLAADGGPTLDDRTEDPYPVAR